MGAGYVEKEKKQKEAACLLKEEEGRFNLRSWIEAGREREKEDGGWRGGKMKYLGKAG